MKRSAVTAMSRLSAMERAERKMVRGRLEAMSVKRLREFAETHDVDLHGATTHLCIVNMLMHQYDKWRSREA